jgi:hypothetical protein
VMNTIGMVDRRSFNSLCNSGPLIPGIAISRIRHFDHGFLSPHLQTALFSVENGRFAPAMCEEVDVLVRKCRSNHSRLHIGNAAELVSMESLLTTLQNPSSAVWRAASIVLRYWLCST